jgi:hypothetical protein
MGVLASKIIKISFSMLCTVQRLLISKGYEGVQTGKNAIPIRFGVISLNKLIELRDFKK